MSEVIEGFVEILSAPRATAATYAGRQRHRRAWPKPRAQLKSDADKLGSQPVSDAAEALKNTIEAEKDLQELGDDVRDLVEVCLKIRSTAP